MAQQGTAARAAAVWSVADVTRFVRVFALGATLLYPLVGLAVATRVTPARAIGAVLVVGVAFHVFGAVANDVCDLDIDRTDPRRRCGPLVAGLIDPPAAMALALSALVPLFVPLVVLGGHGTAARAVAGAVVLGTVYNVAGKRLPVPFVADLVQGAAWALLVVAGAALGGGAGPATPWAALFVVAYIALVNGVLGAVRDVANDRAAGAHTSATLLGATVRDGRVHLPTTLVAYALVLHLVLVVALARIMAVLLHGAPGAVPRLSSAAATGLLAAATVALGRARRAHGDLRRAMAWGTWNLFLTPAALLAAVAWRLPGWAAALAVVAFVAPPVVFGRAVRGEPFALPGTTIGAAERRGPSWAALWESARPGVPLATAGAVAVGAIHGGARPGALAAAVVATVAVVAAAHLSSDRCDEATDRRNHPDRPLPSGRLTAGVVDRAILTCGTVGVAVAAWVSAGAAVMTAVLLTVALAYSWLRRVSWVTGTAVVAGLFAVAVPYGGLVAGSRLSWRHAAAAALIAMVVAAREVLKGVPDVVGDATTGYRTIATRFGPAVAVRGFRVGMIIAFVGALALVPVSTGRAAYAAAVAVLLGAPAALALWHVRGRPDLAAVRSGIDRAGLVFGGGLLALLQL